MSETDKTPKKQQDDKQTVADQIASIVLEMKKFKSRQKRIDDFCE